jgi:3',5'-cyclic AMP phosphodiesterase CpdA
MIVLNSSEDLRKQTLWLEKALADNPGPWTVAIHHHPVYSAAGDRDNDALRQAWKPLYDRFGVDLVLQGHDHAYARGRSRPAMEEPSAGTSHWDGETGTVYVVSVAGPKMYEFKPENWDSYDATLDRKAEDTQLFQVVEVAGETLRFRAYTVGGELFDAFDLVKEKGRPNRLVDRSSESF